MGNSASRASCFFPISRPDQRDSTSFFSTPFDEGLGHTFCYIRPVAPDSPSASPAPPYHKNPFFSSKNDGNGDLSSPAFESQLQRSNPNETIKPKNTSETSFKAISGASVSANTSTPLSITSWEQFNSFSSVPSDCPAAFESTASFSALPLQPLPRGTGPCSGPLSGPLDKAFPASPLERGLFSNPLERGFASGPLERGHLSGPIDFVDRSHFSAPITGFYHRRSSVANMFRRVSRPVKKVISKTMSKTSSTLIRTRKSLLNLNEERKAQKVSSDTVDKSEVQWAQGKAGEDRVHIVLSEEHGWLFVGIYDGFNGPDAPDFLLSNLYPAIQDELQGLLWNRKEKFEMFLTEAGSIGTHSGSKQSADETAIPGDESRDGTLREESHESRKCRGVLSDWEDNGKDAVKPLNDRLQQAELDPAYERAGSPEGTLQAGKENLQLSEERGRESVSWVKKGQDIFSQHKSKAQLIANALALDDEEEDQLRERREGEPAGSVPECRDAVSVLDRRHMKTRGTNKARQVHKGRKDRSKRQLPWRLDLQREAEEAMKREATGRGHGRNCKATAVDHSAVLEALARALEATESAFLDMADQVIDDNPELALMGSCALVMLMKDEDVYIMNVGDSRAVLALKPADPLAKYSNGRPVDQSGNDCDKTGARDSKLRLELERIIEETSSELEALETSHEGTDLRQPVMQSTLAALQLTSDHSTSILEEVLRIQAEHPDDENSVSNDRVKGNLKVTRAFGAGFLKQPKWNNALLEMFQIDYVGTAPYISCKPALYHHRLAPQDHFLVLSSDGLYQYLTNDEVVAHVEWFMKRFPDGDPAQYLIEELLFRAAKKAGMDFHQLLDIPQGDRRKYHDDVSVMVVSLEGRMWRSSM